MCDCEHQDEWTPRSSKKENYQKLCNQFKTDYNFKKEMKEAFYQKKKEDIESGKLHLDVAEATIEGVAGLRPGFIIGGIIEDLLRSFAQPYEPPTEFGGASAQERAERGY